MNVQAIAGTLLFIAGPLIVLDAVVGRRSRSDWRSRLANGVGICAIGVGVSLEDQARDNWVMLSLAIGCTSIVYSLVLSRIENKQRVDSHDR